MAQPQSRHRPIGDQEALLFILQIACGAAAWAIIESLIRHRLLGETLGFFSMWVVMLPFARRTWAADVPVWRYWTAAAMGTATGAALRILFQ
jgi:hypothetical protein